MAHSETPRAPAAPDGTPPPDTGSGEAAATAGTLRPQPPRASRPRRPTTLARQATWRLAGVALLCIAVMSVGGYAYVFEAGRAQALDRLRDFLTQQWLIETTLFRNARANAETFKAEFLEMYGNTQDIPVTDADFDTWFHRGPQGALRTHRRHFTGTVDGAGLPHAGLSGFVSSVEGEPSADLKRRLVLALRLLSRFGPAWDRDFVNTAVSTPEHTLVNYWPEVPWGLQARADLQTASGSVIRATFPEENPERADVWTGLYHDHTAGIWMVTYQMPVDLDGRHLINIGHDVPLDALMARLDTETLPGASRFVVDPGRDQLVAWSEPSGLLDEEGGVQEIADVGDADLSRRYDLLSIAHVGASDPSLWLVEDERGAAWLGATELAGPGWWYVVVYPKAVVTGAAHRAASMVLVFGGVLALILALGVAFVMHRRVGAPLSALTRAAEAVAAGRHAEVAAGALSLPETARNEIGLLACTVRDMAGQVARQEAILDREIAIRTRELEIANRRLQAQTTTDPLTGIGNRRALDADLAAAQGRRQGDGPVALILCDIDHFKIYNDTHGHAEGDEVLRKVAQRMRDTVRPTDSVYRYGGEEIAVLLREGTDGARGVVARLISEVAALGIPHPGGGPHAVVTISAGLAWERPPALDPHDLIERADRNLYAAKASGRNCWIAEESP
ncbi:GGDEF domain-containing protein [Rhodospira trueperi]|uniref:diguanylate cyclase n=1 Tax=Rhodospira trueperi TaxID=69960 RepID=A0A1G7EJF1_9PROT|nr:GGDEF domain-containing protein [Rhodospira trueperi]SDE63526.1 diguanylate cyclase (GGDEF) domain-containing protein [Rhodospira trueperi]